MLTLRTHNMTFHRMFRKMLQICTLYYLVFEETQCCYVEDDRQSVENRRYFIVWRLSTLTVGCPRINWVLLWWLIWNMIAWQSCEKLAETVAQTVFMLGSVNLSQTFMQAVPRNNHINKSRKWVHWIKTICRALTSCKMNKHRWHTRPNVEWCLSNIDKLWTWFWV